MYKTLALLGLLGLLLASYWSDIFFVSQVKKSIFTSDELATFNGVQKPFLYVALMGTVFNVTKGVKHYGVGQQYHVFVGKDASRNFVTGKFKEEDAEDDIKGLSNQELRSLNNWMKFYSREYQRVGNLIGRYYDKFGEPTPYGRQISKLIEEAEEEEQSSQMDKQRFPPCNIEWDADRGSRVWCSDRSVEFKGLGPENQGSTTKQVAIHFDVHVFTTEIKNQVLLRTILVVTPTLIVVIYRAKIKMDVTPGYWYNILWRKTIVFEMWDFMYTF